jgi:hypothetical protein
VYILIHDFMHYIYFAKTKRFIKGLQLRHQVECNHLENTFLVPLVGANLILSSDRGDSGGTVVKVLCYKSKGRWFDSRWCHWHFSLTQSFRSHYGPGVESGVKAVGA